MSAKKHVLDDSPSYNAICQKCVLGCSSKKHKILSKILKDDNNCKIEAALLFYYFLHNRLMSKKALFIIIR